MIVLLSAFLAVIGVNWPELPFGARLADLIFIPLSMITLVRCLVPDTTRRTMVVFRTLAHITWRRSETAIAVYLLASLPAVVVSADPRHGAIELVREIYGAAIYVVMLLATCQGFPPLIAVALPAGVAALSSAGLAIVAWHSITGATWLPMGEVMQLPYLGDTLRLRGLAYTPAMFACLLTAAVPFAISACRSSRDRRWYAAAAVMCIAVIFTFSHAIAGFAVAALIAAWPSLSPSPRRIAIVAVAAIVIAFNFAATASIKSISYGSSSYSDSTPYKYGIDQHEIHAGDLSVTYNVISYFRIKQVAWDTFVAHPIAGIGLDEFHTATERAFEAGRLTSGYREVDPHSTVPGRFAETGLIGGAALLYLLFVFARMAIESARTDSLGLAAAAAFAGLLVCSINADIMNFRFLWVVAGLMRGLQELSAAGAPNASTPLKDHGHAPR